ncbi:hypothetical protein FDC58_14140 [Clostridium botulinum]|uniref:hypothetical protein n=1 Tax=Clostridium sp. ZS1 TaxID=2949989 RepID=UPI0005075905|nr:hypothetical protein [Clostridium sp. ZS1]AIY79964.1 hypothetical protein U728_294 [Clostridium botulinum 202F]KAI3345691.1 hypothetical protein CIT17_11510 [Clostridium botulinum]KFX54928.1 hypothetical protein KU41_18700 [Clostridium botulinum]KON12278.1 hypothetical protein ACP50_10115 [Clostridium botulinum]MBY6803116.1 hypothetical protein [Clostridium botulinum]
MIKYPDKDKILEEFKTKYVDDIWVDNFIRIDEFYRNNKEDIDSELIKRFDLVCEECISMQNDNLKGQVTYIYFSLLRTSILEGNGEFRIDLYDENWFLDKQECSINIELDFLYNSLFEMKSNLKSRKMEYGRTITDMDIEYIILDEADKYHILAVEFLKELVSKFIESDSYKEMKKSSNIKIISGELMDSSEIIYEND